MGGGIGVRPELVGAGHREHHLTVVLGEVPRRRQVHLERWPRGRRTGSPHLPGAGDRDRRAGVEVQPAYDVVGGVGDQHLTGRGDENALRFGELRLLAVDEPARSAAVPGQLGLGVGGQPYDLVVGGVGHEQRPVGQERDLAGEPQGRLRRRRRDVRLAGAPQGALRVVLDDQLLDQAGEPLAVTLAGGDVHEVALRVDDAQRRPGPHGVLRPGREAGVVEHRVTHRVALDRRDDRVVVGLVRELRRVDADHVEHVGEALLQQAQLVEDVQAVDAAERPEVEQQDAAAEVCQLERPAAGADPAAGAGERRSAYASSHACSLPGGEGDGHVADGRAPRCSMRRSSRTSTGTCPRTQARRWRWRRCRTRARPYPPLACVLLGAFVAWPTVRLVVGWTIDEQQPLDRHHRRRHRHGTRCSTRPGRSRERRPRCGS